MDFAEKYNASLAIMNVSESAAITAVPYTMGGYTGESMAAVAKDLNKFHETILDKAGAHAKNAKPNLSISLLLKDGNPASQIEATAKEDDFDVVIVGHRGVSKVHGLFMGSISEKVVHSVPCTVIVIK